MSATTTEAKPKRKRVQVNVLEGRKASLIDFLRSRSSRARNFLHKASTQEHVLYAAISELSEKKLQLELLQSKWDALQRRGAIPYPLSSTVNNNSAPLALGLSDSDESASSLGSSASLSPSNPSDAEGFPSPLRLSSTVEATDPWDLPLFRSEEESLTMDTDSLPSKTRSAPPATALVQSHSFPSSASSAVSAGPRPQLIVPVYREIFHNSGVAMVVLSPSLKVLDFNEPFLNHLPFLMFGPVTRSQLLASGATLIDFFSPTSELGGLFEKIAKVISTGSWHRDGLVVSEKPRLVLDATYFATYDRDASGHQRLRYITSLCRYHDFDGRPESVLALRKNRIGQIEPLPLPSPFASQPPLSDRIRHFVPSFDSAILQRV